MLLPLFEFLVADGLLRVAVFFLLTGCAGLGLADDRVLHIFLFFTGYCRIIYITCSYTGDAEQDAYD